MVGPSKANIAAKVDPGPGTVKQWARLCREQGTWPPVRTHEMTEEERVVAIDNTVRLDGAAMQLAKRRDRQTCAGLRMCLRRHLDGRHSLWWGTCCLGNTPAEPGPAPLRPAASALRVANRRVKRERSCHLPNRYGHVTSLAAMSRLAIRLTHPCENKSGSIESHQATRSANVLIGCLESRDPDSDGSKEVWRSERRSRPMC